MATFLGPFPAGSQPVAIFSGLGAAGIQMRGFGATQHCNSAGCFDSPQAAEAAEKLAAGSSGFDLNAILKTIQQISATGAALFDQWGRPTAAGQNLVNQTGLRPDQILALQTSQQQPKTPAWVLPVAIVGGVALVGAAVWAATR